MKIPRLLFCALSASAVVFSGGALSAATSITDLKCEYAAAPLGIDVAQPRLFWRMTSDERGQRQTAWQLLVATSPELLAKDQGDLWDSGRVESDATTHIAYAGKALASSQRVFWKVRSWDRQSQPTAWSAASEWTMGVLTEAEWKARWIVAPWASESLLVRKAFSVKPNLRRALLHVCGLGHYEVSFNGSKVGSDLLTPGWTNYDKTTLYDTRDVTALVQPGAANAIGLTLGNGMYHVVRRDRFSKFTNSFGPLRVIAQLELEYVDGSRELVGTDDSWRAHAGAITFNSIYGGEDHDARLLPVGWSTPSFDDASWAWAALLVRPDKTLQGFTNASEPVRVIETRQPVTKRELKPGVWLYDFGQNASFMPRLRVSGPAGSRVRMTPGEVVNDDGTIERGTMGGAHRGFAWWQYTKASDSEETWFPQFYYVGSRYLYVELTPAIEGGALPKITSLESCLIHADARVLGSFACSNPRLNQIRDLVRWAQRSNMMSVLTDCPHREKLGWIEQFHLNGPSIRYEFDVARIYTKAMNDMAEAQTEDGLIPNIAPEYTKFKGPFRNAAEWGAAFILVPWQQYQFSGDTGPLRAHYDEMKRYFAFLESRTKDGLLSDGLGDWYDLDVAKKGRAGLTPAPITATAFYFHDAEVLAKAAALLGKADDAAQFTQKAAMIRERYNREFFHAETGTYATNSQCANALPLVLGLAGESQRERALASLIADVEQRGYATAGDIGFRYLLLALAESGRSDVIYRLINQDEKPGYGYQLKQGATALTESWNASRTASHNHFMLGQVTEWLYGYVAGLQPDMAGPGFKKFVVRPQPVGDLTWAEASYESLHGPIKVRWDRVGERFTLHVTIPANTVATVYVPTKSSAEVREGSRALSEAVGVKVLRSEGDRVVLAVESGDYTFNSVW